MSILLKDLTNLVKKLKINFLTWQRTLTVRRMLDTTYGLTCHLIKPMPLSQLMATTLLSINLQYLILLLKQQCSFQTRWKLSLI
ncbi:hypothetical protein EN12_21185 [Vibrio cholerae]|nr:hypothetical protein EN12_21185 [Vibrio cholerae]